MKWIEHAKEQLRTGAKIIQENGFYVIVKGRDRFPLTRMRYVELCDAIGRTPAPPPEPPPPEAIPMKPLVPPRRRGRKSKFTEEQIRQVHRLHENTGASHRQIADIVGLKSVGQVSYIIHRRKPKQ